MKILRMTNIQLLVTTCLNILGLKAQILQSTFSLVQNCPDVTPPNSTVITKETTKSVSHCALECEANPSCQSFAYKKQTSDCLLARSSASACEELEVMEGALTYHKKVESESALLAGFHPDLHFPFDQIINGNVLAYISAPIYNSPILVDGVVGKAMKFNGVDQWADFGTHDCFTDVSQCVTGSSMALWLNVASTMLNPTDSDTYIMSSGGQSASVTTGGMGLHTKNGALAIIFRQRSTSERWKITDIAINGDQWFHFAATWNKYGGLTVFVNGAEVASTDVGSYTPSAPDRQTMLHVGKPNGPTNRYCEVQIDEWYFWERVLSSGEATTAFGLY